MYTVYKTLRSASKLPEIMKYLLAWLLLSDSVNTIIVQASLFAQTQLGVPIVMLAALAALVPFSAIAGACKFNFFFF